MGGWSRSGATYGDAGAISISREILSAADSWNTRKKNLGSVSRLGPRELDKEPIPLEPEAPGVAEGAVGRSGRDKRISAARYNRNVLPILLHNLPTALLTNLFQFHVRIGIGNLQAIFRPSEGIADENTLRFKGKDGAGNRGWIREPFVGHEFAMNERFHVRHTCFVIVWDIGHFTIGFQKPPEFGDFSCC
jgi:hypothetical protein